MAAPKVFNLEESGIGPILRGEVAGIYTVFYIGDSISHIGNQPASVTGQSSMFHAVARHFATPWAALSYPVNTNSGLIGTRIFTAIEGGTSTSMKNAEASFGAGGAYNRLAYQDVLRELVSTGTVADGWGTVFQLTVDDGLLADNAYAPPAVSPWLETAPMLVRVGLYKMQSGMPSARIYTGRGDDSPFGANDLAATITGGAQSLVAAAGEEEWVEFVTSVNPPSGAFTRPTARVEIAPSAAGQYSVIGYVMFERTDLTTGLRLVMGGNGGGKIEGVLDADDPAVGAEVVITRDAPLRSYLQAIGWPRIIPIQIGANDGSNMLSSTWRDKYKRAMARLAWLYASGGASYSPKFLLVAPYPVQNTLSVANVQAGEDWLIEIATSGVSGVAGYPVTIPTSDIAVISLRECLAAGGAIANGVNADGSMIRGDQGGILLVDSIHPNARGTDVIGPRMWAAIAESGASTTLPENPSVGGASAMALKGVLGDGQWQRPFADPLRGSVALAAAPGNASPMQLRVVGAESDAVVIDPGVALDLGPLDASTIEVNAATDDRAVVVARTGTQPDTRPRNRRR